MPLKTKSIQLKPSKNDGIRVCIMRRPPEGSKFDIWMPNLAPTNEILDARHNGKMTFEEHKAWFAKHVLQEQKVYIDILLEISKKRVVTLLCWEIDTNACHRKWVIEECRRLATFVKSDPE